MHKKYIVRLTDAERATCRETIHRLKGSSEKVRRAQMLLKADVDGPGWSDRQIAEAFGCRTKTVENLRRGVRSARPLPARIPERSAPCKPESVFTFTGIRSPGGRSRSGACRRQGRRCQVQLAHQKNTRW